MHNIWNSIYFDNTVKGWLIALGILLASFMVIVVFKRIVIRRLEMWAGKSDNKIDDFVVSNTAQWVVPMLYIFAVYFSVNTLKLSQSIGKVIHIAYMVALTYFALRLISAVIRQFVFSFIKIKDNGEAKEKQAKGLLMIINVAIWVLGIVFLIDNMGYNVTTLVAGLGIGGIAIALAAQTILGDLFSYFVIFFDRPFEIGDFIVIENKMGTVEYVGIKTTRLRTLEGEQLICSNTYLTNARVHNYKRMNERRIVFKLGLIYQTSHAQLKMVPKLVKDIIESKGDVRFDRGHFSGFGDFSLNFEFVYYVLNADYTFFMDKQQEIYLGIVDTFEKEGIEFAYPTQSLIINAPSVVTE